MGIRWWEWLGLGLLLGLGALSKLQGLGLLPLAAITFLLYAKRQKEMANSSAGRAHGRRVCSDRCRLVVRA